MNKADKQKWYFYHNIYHNIFLKAFEKNGFLLKITVVEKIANTSRKKKQNL